MNINPPQLSRQKSLDTVGIIICIPQAVDGYKGEKRKNLTEFTLQLPPSSSFYSFFDLIVVIGMVKKHFHPTPDMVSQSSGDCRSAFLLPFALSERQTHVRPDEIIEHLKDEYLPFEFLFYLRCCQCSPYQRA